MAIAGCLGMLAMLSAGFVFGQIAHAEHNNGNACHNTATTTSVLDDFNGPLSVESSLQCDSNENCEEGYDRDEKSAFLDLSNVLNDGQTPGDLTVSFRGNEPYWSKGFTADIDCAKSADEDCEAGALIQYLEGQPDYPQRSERTEFTKANDGIDRDHNAGDWIIEDIEDDRQEVRLRTEATSSIGAIDDTSASGEYDETARSDITIDDIQLQVCEADDNTSPTADDEGTLSYSICASDNLDINVLEGDSDPDDDDSLTVVGLSNGSTNDPFTDTTETNSGSGTAAIINGGDGEHQVRYTPDSGFTGNDSFQYKVSDGNGGSDTAMVYLDVQGEDGGCGDIRVSFQSTNDANPGGTADPTYDHPTTSLSSQTAASSGEELVWNVPLEKATNTAEMIRDNIDPPDGYQLAETDGGFAKIRKHTELFEQFERSSKTDQTDENTSAWLGEDYTPDSQSTTTCSTTVAASDWSGEPTSYSYAEDTDEAGNEKTSDGKATATLDITNYVGSDDTLNSVSVGYTGSAECDSDAASCSASATTTVTFSNGSSTARSVSTDSSCSNQNLCSREYLGPYETTDSSVTSTKVINDSSASITRDYQDVEARATGTLQKTNIYWETTDSCN